LTAGETLRVDTGCIVALQPSVSYDIQLVGGVKTALFGGEGLFLATLTGPGKVWLQSMPILNLAEEVACHLPGNEEVRGSGIGAALGGGAAGAAIGGILGGILGNE